MICNKCVGILNIAWQFKQQCESSDAKLRQYFGSSQHLQVTPDLDGFNIGVKDEQRIFPLQHEAPLIPLIQPQLSPPIQAAPPIAEVINNVNLNWSI